MGLLQQPLQAKLSKLIGAEVRIDSLNVSLLGGSIEARGVTVAGDEPGRPVLTVRRVRAEISISRALKKEIVIKSLTIEAPMLSVVKRTDGRMNLPKPAKGARAPGKTLNEEGGGDDDGGAWKLEAQRVLLVDGAARYHADARAGGETVDFSADSITAELKSAGGGLDFTCIVESLGSRGARPVELGQLKFAGRAEGVEDLSQILKARVAGTVDMGQLLKADVEIPSISPIRAIVNAAGNVNLEKVAPLLPRAVLNLLPPNPPGKVALKVVAEYTPAELTVSELSLRAESLRLKP